MRESSSAPSDIIRSVMRPRRTTNIFARASGSSASFVPGRRPRFSMFPDPDLRSGSGRRQLLRVIHWKLPARDAVDHGVQVCYYDLKFMARWAALVRLR
jgi:hypothetical protein